MPISRKEATEKNLKFYDMFAPCRRGHIGQRYTKNQMCVTCQRENAAKRYAIQPEPIKEASRVWFKNNKVRRRATRRTAYAENPKKFLQRNAAWHRKYPAKNTAKTQRYKTRKLKAYPRWLTKEQEISILEIYTQAKRLSLLIGLRYDVDHIVPLAGNNVCGLHVPWNLQILPAWENRSKSNQWETVQ
jgi:hypothetical protein